MRLEDQLKGWTGPSSPTEQDKQDRTERMVREAVAAHKAFAGCSLTVYAKGSYANNTNVRTDSDVDIAVQCHEAEYWDEATPGTHKSSGSYISSFASGASSTNPRSTGLSVWLFPLATSSMLRRRISRFSTPRSANERSLACGSNSKEPKRQRIDPARDQGWQSPCSNGAAMRP